MTKSQEAKEMLEQTKGKGARMRPRRRAVEINSNNNNISDVSPNKRLNALQGHNAFNQSGFWTSPTQKRRRTP